jgi:hypothetical protein
MDIDKSRSGRPFRKEWMLTRQQLEYSSSLNKAFRLPCHLFGKSTSNSENRIQDVFSVQGYDDWKNAVSRGFVKHESSEIHRTCTEMMENRVAQLQNAQYHSSIDGYLSTAFQQRQEERKKAMENRKFEEYIPSFATSWLATAWS